MRRLTLLLFAMLNAGCFSELLTADMPPTLTLPAGTAQLDSTGEHRLDGVYKVVSGSDIFGDELVALWRRDHLCLYSGTQVIFSENACGIAGDTARMNGYYRFVRSDQTGNLSLQVFPSDGGSSLHAGASPLVGLTIRGSYEDAVTGQWHELVLTRERPVNQKHFYVLGNCAGGRNSERLGRSENSIEMARFADYLGCNGVEVDLHTTADGEVILMHDDDFTPRTVASTYVLGPVSNFTMRQIRRDARLIHGEMVPTLGEFLRFAVDSTNFEMIWLDPKVTTGVDRVVEEQYNAVKYARSIGRKNFHIVFGTPDVNILAAFNAAPLHDSVEALSELEPSDALQLKSAARDRSLHFAWGPRWTRGCSPSEVANAQAADSLWVFPWTIDSPDYMTQFLDCTTYDGILSNYPSMLTGQYYLRQ